MKPNSTAIIQYFGPNLTLGGNLRIPSLSRSFGHFQTTRKMISRGSKNHRKSEQKVLKTVKMMQEELIFWVFKNKFWHDLKLLLLVLTNFAEKKFFFSKANFLSIFCFKINTGST
mgnify:CR=1 FL=1